MWYNHRSIWPYKKRHTCRETNKAALSQSDEAFTCLQTHTHEHIKQLHTFFETNRHKLLFLLRFTYIHTRVLATMIMFSILIMTTVMISEMKIVMHKGTIMTSMRKMMIMMKMRMTMMMWAILITTHND